MDRNLFAKRNLAAACTPDHMSTLQGVFLINYWPTFSKCLEKIKPRKETFVWSGIGEKQR